LELADLGYEAAIDTNPALKRGLNVCQGKITHKAVADAFGMEYSEL
jgi:alanine dehydrogenase